VNFHVSQTARRDKGSNIFFIETLPAFRPARLVRYSPKVAFQSNVSIALYGFHQAAICAIIPRIAARRSGGLAFCARLHEINETRVGRTNDMPEISMEVNGRPVRADVSGNMLLSDFLRQNLALTGTHVGCDTSQCGACVVHLNGNSVKSCTVLAAQMAGAKITTIEGLSQGGDLHPLQAAFRDAHGLQCGFCTPGMIMSAADLLSKNANPSEPDIRKWLSGNMCRCTGYHNIVKAVQMAAGQMSGHAAAAE
jgi:carbon-monoxide dehydrogenase small subunit